MTQNISSDQRRFDKFREASVAKANLADLGAKVRRAHLESGRWLVVLDDDPTGSQSVHGVPVITDWSAETIRWAFEQEGGGFFILTNTRALLEEDVRETLGKILSKVFEVAQSLGKKFSILLRMDSTLRGHFELENSIVIEQAVRTTHPVDLVLFAPAYLDAGRVTLEDVHWVRSGDDFVPVSETDYAHDLTFGFESAHLPEYVEEKSKGSIRAEDVHSISLTSIREGGVAAVRAQLLGVPKGSVVVVNAVDRSDLDVVAMASIDAEASGLQILYRTGPSFVAAYLGVDVREPLFSNEIFPSGPRAGHGLVVVGSHVEITNHQLRVLGERVPDLPSVELRVDRVLDATTRDEEISRCQVEVLEAVKHSDVLLFTSRSKVAGSSREDSLRIAQSISASIVSVVRHALLRAEVSWLIAKGGITSSDIATEAVGASRALVAGQLLPGMVSVWLNKSEDEPRLAGIPIVIFAGNVGSDQSLADAIEILKGATSDHA